MHCALIVVCDKALTFVVKCLASNIIADHAGIRNVSIIICCLKKDITDRIRPSLKSNKKNLCFIKKKIRFSPYITPEVQKPIGFI